MKDKHIKIRIEQCIALSKASNCPRLKIAAMLLDPIRNVVLSDAYNGAARNGTELCGDNCCIRDQQNIESGTQIEVGCHHAEMNLICNAAASGTKTQDSWMFITGAPCKLCSKLIHHAGIKKVIIIDGGYCGQNGLDYLEKNGIQVEFVSGPKDERNLIKGE